MNLFKEWMKAMGYHGKQVTEAGKSIGFGETNAISRTHRGLRELTITEQLAMSAVRAGLKPWTMENDHEAVAASNYMRRYRDEPATTSVAAPMSN